MNLKNKNFKHIDIKKKNYFRNDELICFWVKINNVNNYNKFKKDFEIIFNFDEYNNEEYLFIDEDDYVIYYTTEQYNNFCEDTGTDFEVFAFVGHNSNNISKATHMIKISERASSILGISDEFESWVAMAKHLDMITNNPYAHESNYKNEDNAYRHVSCKFDDHNLDLSDELL